MAVILSKWLTMSLKDAMKRDVCILSVPAALFQAIYHLKIEPLFHLTRIHMYESQCIFNFLYSTQSLILSFSNSEPHLALFGNGPN